MTDQQNEFLNQIELLKTGTNEEQQTAMESLIGYDLSDDILRLVCGFIGNPDKGVKNAASMLLMTSNNANVPKCIVKYISSDEISTRNLAGEVLIRLGGLSVEAILAYLNEGRSDDDQKFLIDVLGLIGDPRAGEDILNILRVSENSNVILACVEALGHLKYNPGMQELVSVYDRDEFYKPTVIEAMGQIGSKDALDFMVLTYEKEDDLTKFSIIESLGLIGDEGTFFFLISELNNISGPLMFPVISSIYQLKEKFSFDIPFDERMKQAILKTILEADPEYKKAAVHLITVFDDKETILTCLKIFGEDSELDESIKPKFFENPKMIFPTASELINQDPKNLASLLNLLKEVFEYAENVQDDVISPLDLRNLTDSFTRCLDSSDEEVRRVAIELLFQLNQSTALLFLDTMVEDNDLWNRLKIVEILDGINNPKADRALLKLSNDPEEMFRERAQFALSQRANPQLEIQQSQQKNL